MTFKFLDHVILFNLPMESQIGACYLCGGSCRDLCENPPTSRRSRGRCNVVPNEGSRSRISNQDTSTGHESDSSNETQTQSKHPLKGAKQLIKKKDFNSEDFIKTCEDYITDMVTKPCLYYHRNSYSNCQCVKMNLYEDITRTQHKIIVKRVAYIMLGWGKILQPIQKDMVLGWIRYSKKGNNRFLLPTIGDVPDGFTSEYANILADKEFCLNGLCSILNLRTDFVNGLKNHPNGMPIVPHQGVGKVGRESNRTDKVMFDALDEYFKKLKMECQPFSTEVVREAASLTVRGDVETLSLPPYYSKRRVYGQYLWENGWKLTLSSRKKGSYVPLSETEVRENNDSDWPIGSQPKAIVSWRAFIQFWNAHYPQIRIRAKGADTCSECMLYVNSISNLRLKQSTKHQMRQYWTKTGPLHLDKLAEQNQYAILKVQDQIQDQGSDLHKEILLEDKNLIEDAKDECINEDSLNEILDTAKDHIKKAKFQREVYNRYTEYSKVHEKTLTLTMDMSQNVEVPHLGAEQPGETYYLSAMTGFIFGIVENSTDILSAYVWMESEGDRGMNNIVSCLHKDLSRRGVFLKKITDLVIFADNCAGQNKNRCVIRYLIWLVEAGYVRSCNLIFLIKGHTKNKCDRLFNLLKQYYSRSNIFTPSQLIDHLNLSPQVNVHRFQESDFKNYNKWLSKYYQVPETNTIKDFHQFTIKSDNPTVLLRYSYSDAKVEDYKQNFLPKRGLKKMEHIMRKNSITLQNMKKEIQKLNPPGITPIKQMDFFDKWRNIVPECYWKEICPRPDETVINYVNEQKQRKKQEKQSAKEISKRIKLTK